MKNEGFMFINSKIDFRSEEKAIAAGKYGEYGGRFVPEILVSPLIELEEAFEANVETDEFQQEFQNLLQTYVGRPTPLTYCKRLSTWLGGGQIYLKREDLTHTGAHKINNAIGQALLARNMGKKRLIAETGAGQHGVATATAAALLGLKCIIYMGSIDIERQNSNVLRMKLLGAQVRSVESGSKTLKDAINEAMRDWVTNVDDSYYLLGSALGPFPYPKMVKKFQSVIGKETIAQIMEVSGRLPDICLACVGGGSNSIGFFSSFIEHPDVKLVGVEAGGKGISTGHHAARFADPIHGRKGVLHGTYTYVLQDPYGQICETHSISAGLDYPAVGPEHAFLRDIGRVEYCSIVDKEALEAFQILAKYEGILPALESSHAIAEGIKRAPHLGRDQIMVINLSGRGDKDLDTVTRVIESGVLL
jgi:tryptophan synthase beta chain